MESNKLCKCGKVGELSCPKDERCGTANTQLPAEVSEEIKLSAQAFAAGMWSGISKHDAKQREYVAEVWKAGATEYATKLQEAEVKINNRDGKIELLMKARRAANESADTMIALLTEVYQKHESGMLPDRFVYDKIKKFLYGE